jgi:hypothetical protein
MAERKFLSVVAVPAVVAVILGGLPAAAQAVTAAAAGGGAIGGRAFGPLTPALTARLSQDVDEPVIVVLRSQAGPGQAGA